MYKMSPQEKKIEKKKLSKINKKRCSHCNLIKKYSSYSPDNSKTDGYAHNCRVCRNKYGKRNKKIKRANSVLHRITDSIRSRTSYAIKSNGYKKDTKTFELIGCTKEFLLEYLKSKFKKGMTLNNYGKWQIDHDIPLASAKTEKELKALAHYSNLKPMWANENNHKRAKSLGQQYKIRI